MAYMCSATETDCSNSDGVSSTISALKVPPSYTLTGSNLGKDKLITLNYPPRFCGPPTCFRHFPP